MKALDIPVRVVGPGSQAEEDSLQYLAVPREMDVFRMPGIPPRADTRAMREARDVLQRFADRFAMWEIGSPDAGPRLALDGVPPATLRVLNQVLGEGEVSVRVDAPRLMRIQESVFAGIWRVCEFDADGRMTGDWIEAGALPPAVLTAAHAGTVPLRTVHEIPPGAMNSPALLHEIAAHMRARRPGSPARVINLTLFPLTPEDHEVMEIALPVGPVAIMSRGFGNCRITSTGAKDVWRVQYFNTMNTLILNTLEVVDAPEVALAAADDLADSRERFGELLAWMADDIASAGNG